MSKVEIKGKLEQYKIMTLDGLEHKLKARSLEEVKKWRDKNLCKFQKWNIQVMR